MFVLLGNLAARLEETYSLESRVEVGVCYVLLCCPVVCCFCLCVFGVICILKPQKAMIPRREEYLYCLVAISCELLSV